MSKTALILMILIPCAILAIPAWLLMRSLNEGAAKRREREAARDDAKWDQEIARVREEMKRK